ncbi:MAG: CDP-tyvelose epimerase, partial [Verrucomicrobiota bacterium]
AHLRGRSLRYLGFDGSGAQVRDCLHPKDLFRLVRLQMKSSGVKVSHRVVNVSGGATNSMSLAELTEWCDNRWRKQKVEEAGEDRKYDLPWVVLDSSKCSHLWDWSPQIEMEEILNEIADHAEANPSWLSISGVR